MCRIAAYFGPPVSLSVLLDGPHGLVHQSQAAREMSGPSVAGDGWGVGWFPQGGGPPGLLKSTLPIWSCVNARTAPHAIVTRSGMGHVRLASPGIETCFLNTPLYEFGGHLFTVNGELKPWPGPLARALRAQLDDEDEAAVQGSTDAEMLGALWHTCLRQVGDPGEALRVAHGVARAEGGLVKVNVIVAGRGGWVAVRYADGDERPNSLYYAERGGGAVVASEPLDDAGGWRRVPPGSLVRADAGGIAEGPLGLEDGKSSAGAPWRVA